MSPRARNLAWIVCALLLLAFLMPTGRPLSQEIQRVLVTNFPDVQRILGTVSVEGPVRHASLQKFPEIVVQPVEPSRTRRLVPAGTLSGDGFTSVALSLGGQLRSAPLKAGTVGAIFVPDEDSILRAFEEDGKNLFSLEIGSGVGGTEDLYFSSSREAALSFPRYRVYLYNTTNRVAVVSLFAYLKN